MAEWLCISHARAIYVGINECMALISSEGAPNLVQEHHSKSD